ncbi:protein-disulfide isomerase [Frondihabitans sp. PhB188]|uniref:DsbA family protein n=1 Tax=Frondihabitans sp. PhB188 TaxID=2485200 RepID=UPI000F9E50FA|nr:thioredoxin domain-containing protein [Frondihabitans sp. PhB188]ROQ39967.1 protein-disulfide isomerase [Frondihabitans sp. PhB188]
MPAPETKNDRRRAARERARQAMAAQRRSAARRALAIRSGIVAGVIAVLAVVALVVVSGITPPGPGPRNLAGDGVRIGEGFVAERSVALQPGAEATPPAAHDADAVTIRVYIDYLCPNCGAFEAENGDYIEGLVKSGAAVVEYHPIAILDRLSQGSKYSTRATAAALCAADLAPDSFFAVNAKLLADQPAENTAGLTNEQLVSQISGTRGLKNPAAVAECVRDQRFAPTVAAVTKRVADNATAGSDVAEFRGTPTVIIDGRQWEAGAQTFRAAVASATATRAAAE